MHRCSLSMFSLSNLFSLYLKVNLNSSFDLRVEKLSASRCVEVRWNLTQAGACYVKYNVILKDASGARLFTSSGYQLHLLRMCSKRIFNSVSDVQLNVSFKNKFTIVTTKVSGANRNGSTSSTSLFFEKNYIFSYHSCKCFLVIRKIFIPSC